MWRKWFLLIMFVYFVLQIVMGLGMIFHGEFLVAGVVCVISGSVVVGQLSEEYDRR